MISGVGRGQCERSAAQEEDIIALFNTAAHEPQLEGAVEAVRLIKDGKTNVGKGIGYVLLRNRTAVLAALQLNGSECKGRKMRVMRVKASAGGANAQKVEAGRKGRGAGGGKKGATPAQRVGGNPAGACSLRPGRCVAQLGWTTMCLVLDARPGSSWVLLRT